MRKKEKEIEREGVRVKQKKEAMCTSLTCTAICVKHLGQNSNQVLHHFTLLVSGKLILISSGSANGCLARPSIIPDWILIALSLINPIEN